MLLQAAIDDSRSRPSQPDGIYLLGGLLAPYEAWAAFSDEWSAALNKAPRLEFFKTSQALAMKDQFDPSRGWTTDLRDSRVESLAKIVRKYALCGISCYMPQDLYREFVRSFSAFKELDDPYFLCFFQIADAITSARSIVAPSATGLDYIFDEQGNTGRRVIQWWDRLKDAAPWRHATDVGSTPIYRDDKTFLPLQASDLYAGYRRHMIQYGSPNMPVMEQVSRAFSGLAAWDRTWSRDDVLNLTAHMVVRNALRNKH